MTDRRSAISERLGKQPARKPGLSGIIVHDLRRSAVEWTIASHEVHFKAILIDRINIRASFDLKFANPLDHIDPMDDLDTFDPEEFVRGLFARPEAA